MPLPDSIKNAPSLNYGLNLYYNAFFKLNKCRTLGLGTISPFTWFMLVDFCDRNDIIGEQRDDFIEIMTAMDDAYIKHVNGKSKP